MSNKITLEIIGMTCPNCAMILESIEDKIGGVIRAEASYRKAQLTVEYDPARLSEEAIRQEVKRLGYDVV